MEEPARMCRNNLTYNYKYWKPWRCPSGHKQSNLYIRIREDYPSLKKRSAMVCHEKMRKNLDWIVITGRGKSEQAFLCDSSGTRQNFRVSKHLSCGGGRVREKNGWPGGFLTEWRHWRVVLKQVEIVVNLFRLVKCTWVTWVWSMEGMIMMHQCKPTSCS